MAEEADMQVALEKEKSQSERGEFNKDNNSEV
jgi:hypothetical protein